MRTLISLVNYFSTVAAYSCSFMYLQCYEYIVYILPAVLNKLPSKVYMAAVSILLKCWLSIVFVCQIKWPAFIDICVYDIGDLRN